MAKNERKRARPAGGLPAREKGAKQYRYDPAVAAAFEALNASLSPPDRYDWQTAIDKAFRRFLTEHGFRPADEPEPKG